MCWEPTPERTEPRGRVLYRALTMDLVDAESLAKFAMARGETSPAWMKHVRPDVRVILKQSLRFLAR